MKSLIIGVKRRGVKTMFDTICVISLFMLVVATFLASLALIVFSILVILKLVIRIKEEIEDLIY